MIIISIDDNLIYTEFQIASSISTLSSVNLVVFLASGKVADPS